MLNKLKKALTFVLVIVMALSISTTAFASENNEETINSDNDEEIIRGIIYEYFDSQFKNLQDLKIVDTTVKPSELTVENELFYETEQAALKVQLDFLSNQKEDLRFSIYNYSLKFTNINIAGNTAEVELTEDHEIQFNYLDTPSYLKDKPHAFTLIKKDNNWIITDHEDGSLLKTEIKRDLQVHMGFMQKA